MIRIGNRTRLTRYWCWISEPVAPEIDVESSHHGIKAAAKPKMYGGPPSGSLRAKAKTAENTRSALGRVRSVQSAPPAVPAYVIRRSWIASDQRTRR